MPQGQAVLPPWAYPFPSPVMPSPPQHEATRRDRDDSGDSEDGDRQAAAKRIKTFQQTYLSKSFKHWGGEDRPITRAIRAMIMEVHFPELDMNLVGQLSSREFDKMFFVLYGVRPDAKLAATNLIGAQLADVLRLLQKSRTRLARCSCSIQTQCSTMCLLLRNMNEDCQIAATIVLFCLFVLFR